MTQLLLTNKVEPFWFHLIRFLWGIVAIAYHFFAVIRQILTTVCMAFSIF